ncbi:MAG: Rrf2 family transcriptional regulator [bacterium]|nr:Rrf2 family transcriptional regulator [bacterium]
MRLFKSSEYAIRCLVYMAGSEADLCPVQKLSDELNIPYKFLGRLMGRLRDAGFVESVRGKSGGYRIKKMLDQIHLEQIIDAVEGLENFDRCLLGFDTCDANNPCPMHEFWIGPKENIQSMMADVTLADMVKSSGKKLS